MVKTGGDGSQDKGEERSGQSSKYRGVRKRKWGKWVSEIRLPNSRERIWLGSYDSAEKAAKAFDAALFCLRGPSADFNFPDCPPHIDGGNVLSRSEIQLAASKFANSHASSSDAAPTTVDSPCDSDNLTPVHGSYDSGMIPEEPYLDLLDRVGPLNFPYAYGYFSEYDGFVGHPEYPSAVDYLEQETAYESSYSHGSLLWNF